MCIIVRTISSKILYLNSFHMSTSFHSKRCFSSNVSKFGEWNVSDKFTNPISMLQEYVQVPILSESEVVFTPSQEHMEAADKIFRMSLDNRAIASIKGVINSDLLPPTELPEVCFIGQSNVGKSSLIKALFFNPAIRISVSKKPGHTRAMQFYELAHKLTLVDMPGYGQNMPQHYIDSVEHYLQTRHCLVRTFLLLDAEDGVTETDKIGIKMMEEFRRPYTIVLTKVDRTTRHHVIRNIFDLKKKRNSLMPSALPQPFVVRLHKLMTFYTDHIGVA